MKKCLLILFSVICVGVCILAFVSQHSREDNTKNANIQDGTIGQKGTGKFLIGDAAEPVQRDVCIMFDYADDELYHYSRLVVKGESQAITYNLSESGIGSYADLLYVCDVDGDNADEIIIQRTVGMTGGAGQYISQIFKVEKNQIIEIFNSASANKFNTGYSSKMEDNYELVVVNQYTNYEKTVDISDKKYLGGFYTEEGKLIKEIGILVDSFYSFSPIDVDKDGVFEIKTYQYVSLNGHSDGIGTAASVLKFRSDTQEFEVIETEFKTEVGSEGQEDGLRETF